MKPDSDLHGLDTPINLNPNPSNLSKNIISLKTPNSRQKHKSITSKTLKQQIDPISKQQWISDAAFYKAEARGFIPGYEAADWLEAEQDYAEMLVEMFLSVFKEDASMTVTGLRQLAKAIGVPKPEKIDSKLELIRLIQAASHHRPCFRTKPSEFCHKQADCQWQTECQKLVAEWWR
jgi:Protein of unknown function (DUF2934)